MYVFSNKSELVWSGRLIANEQAERRQSACEAASLMPRKILQQAEKFSMVLWKV